MESEGRRVGRCVYSARGTGKKVRIRLPNAPAAGKSYNGRARLLGAMFCEMLVPIEVAIGCAEMQRVLARCLL